MLPQQLARAAAGSQLKAREHHRDHHGSLSTIILVKQTEIQQAVFAAVHTVETAVCQPLTGPVSP